MKSSFVRTIVFVVFIGLVLFGLIFNEGWGTLCSFGYQAVAAVCPLGALEQMIASHVFVPKALIGIAIFFISVVLFGRFFCGWLCPVPNLRRLFSRNKNPEVEAKPVKLSGKYENPAHRCACDQGAVGSEECNEVSLKNERLAADQTDSDKGRAQVLARNMPYVVLGGTVASTALFGFPVFCLICPVGLFFALIIALWQLFAFSELSWSLPAVIAVLVLEVFVLRRWCHKFCPLGALISLMSLGNRFFRPKIDHSGCLKSAHGIACRKCRAVCPVDIDLHAAESASVLSKCMKCRQCADACPQKVISFPFLNSSGRQSINACQTNLAGAAVQTDSTKAHNEGSMKLTEQSVRAWASRCVACGKCVEACPVHNPISQWMALVAEGKFVQAGRLLFLPGAMPEVCSRICPQEKLCEGACPLAVLGQPLPIGALSTFISDNYLQKRRYTSKKHRKANGKVAVIGAGPCGLACADVLNSHEVEVVVFDRHPEAGGMLRYAIPDFKLDKQLLSRRCELLSKAGIEFRFNSDIGRTVDFNALLKQFDAVFVAIGASEAHMPELMTIDNPCVDSAIDYLERANRSAQQAQEQVKGRSVAVLGAGDTAMDALRTVLHFKAASATCICRNDSERTRASRREQQAAVNAGAKFVFNVETIGLANQANGAISISLRERSTNKITQMVFDVVLVAYGQHPVAAQWLKNGGVTQLTDGRISIKDNYQTANPKVFAGGDVVRGSSLAVKCILDGRQAADSIVDYLRKTEGRA